MTTLGAQYYRPPNPPRSDWRRDLERMKAAGLNTVKLWACWSWMNVRDGQFDFEDLRELLDHAAELGLAVVVNTIIENAPYWLEERAPHARYRDHENREIQLSAAMNTPGGGWPGLCFDNPEVLASAGEFLTELVVRFDSHAAMSAWDVWNEPHLEPASYFPDRIYCYCDASVAKFTAWLKLRYSTIDRLNEAWSRRYSSWSQVAPPRVFEAVPDMLDWREFWFENLRSWLDWRAETVRAAGATRTVMTHVALSGFTGQLATHTLDEFTLTRTVDAFGTSSFPTWLMADDHVEHLFNLDTARDAAAGKPFWQAELQGGRGRRDGLASTGQPHPSVVSLWMWNALAAGATGIMFWQWRPELLGPESPGYGLCAPDGSVTERVAAVTDFAPVAALPLLKGRETEPATIGLLVSRKAAVHAYATDRTMALYRDAVMGAYRMLTDRDVAITVLHEDRVADEGVPRHIRSIYWPMPSVTSDAVAAALANFVRGGGTLVSEAGPGEYSETGHRRTEVPSGELRQVFGTMQVETTTPSAGEVIALGTSEISVAWQIERAQESGADIVGVFRDGTPAVTSNHYGTGRGILISSYPSLAYSTAPTVAMAASIVALLGAESEQRALRWESVRPGLITRRARTPEGKELVFAINWTREAAHLSGDRPIELVAGSALTADTLRPLVEAMSAALFATGE